MLDPHTNRAEPVGNYPRIWIDADACPNQIKELIFNTSRKRQIPVTVVANQTIRAPDSEFISVLTVPDGADKADDCIVDQIKENDLVITGDIPLAARAIEKNCAAIGVRGELYDESSIGSRLATRNLMQHLRSGGMETKGPKPFGPRDLKAFANQLDRILTKLNQRKSE
ncbi:MAG: DUF188 domain-containing protein [Planctomycetaceae bacterium]|nr:DUF188 domain-containing protein [Planctomycetaceae bacterium]|tara:strand:+ start:1370 stop:1876 length:507 start_codon:yes stop_codon:yes gene_type:complete